MQISTRAAWLALCVGLLTWASSGSFITGLWAWCGTLGVWCQYRWLSDGMAKAREANARSDAGYAPAPGAPGGAQVRFTYTDAEGHTTRREVSVWSVGTDRLQGWCHARRAQRTFLLERIEGDVTVVDTGELVSPSELREVIQ